MFNISQSHTPKPLYKLDLVMHLQLHFGNLPLQFHKFHDVGLLKLLKILQTLELPQRGRHKFQSKIQLIFSSFLVSS